MALSGRKIRIKRDGVALVGARVDNLAINAEPIDQTDKDDLGWRTLLADAGVRTVSGDVEGVLKGATTISQAMAAGNLLIDAGQCDIDGVASITGNFFLSAMTFSGEQADVVAFTANFESSGTITASVAPYNTVRPVISGTPTVGQTLTRTLGTWAGNATITYATQWQESVDGVTWTNISGATGATYVLQAAQAGDRVRARVTATNSIGSTVAFSNTLGPVAP
jgi:predicted secreted protein